MSHSKSFLLCNHANEVPVRCPCDDDCICKEHSCRSCVLLEDGTPLRADTSGQLVVRNVGGDNVHSFSCSQCVIYERRVQNLMDLLALETQRRETAEARLMGMISKPKRQGSPSVR